MKKHVKQARVTLLMTAICQTVSCLSLSLIAAISNVHEESQMLLGYLIAGIFWGGLLAAILLSFGTRYLLEQDRQALIQEGRLAKQRLPGIFHVSLRLPSLVLYGVGAVGLILIVTDIFLGYVPEAVMFPIISFTLLSFALHCIVDGKYYQVYHVKQGESQS